MSYFVTLKSFKFFVVNEKKIHPILLDRHMQLIGVELILDSAELHLESFCPPCVVGIDLPHDGVCVWGGEGGGEDSFKPAYSIPLLLMSCLLGSMSLTQFFSEYPGFNTKILT